MNLRNFFFIMAFLTVISFASDSFAASITNENATFDSDTTVDSIKFTTSDNNNPWTINVNNGNLTVNHTNSENAISVNYSSMGKIIGNGNNDLIINSSPNINATRFNYGSMEFENINIIINNSGGLPFYTVYDGSTTKVTGNSGGTNKIVINNSQSQYGAFGLALGAKDGSMSFENMNIEVINGNAYTGFWSISNNNGNMNIKGLSDGSNYIKIDKNKTNSGNMYGYSYVVYGITNKDDSNKLFPTTNIENMDIYVTNNIGHKGVVAVNNSGENSVLNIKGIESGNNFIVQGNTREKTVIEAFSGSKTNIENMNFYIDNKNFAYIKDGASLTLKNNQVFYDKEAYTSGFHTDSGTSEINIIDSKLDDFNGYFLNVQKDAVSTLNVDNSTISGYVTTFSEATSNMIFTNGGVWHMNSFSNVSNLTNTDSLIDLRAKYPYYFNTLNVGSYSSMNGRLVMNVELGDDASLSDSLVINGGGNVTGSTQIEAMVVGSNGNNPGDNGIKIVAAENGTTIDSGVFYLKGGQVDNSAYVYKLFQGDADGLDTQSYYLRSTGKLSNIAKTLANEPTTIHHIARTGMNSLQKRMGDLRENSYHNQNGFWVRSYGKDLKVNDKITTTLDIFGTESGYDHRWDYDDYKLYAGAMVGYMDIRNIKNKQHNSAKDGVGDGNSYSVGIYGTIMNNNGWFVDGVIRNFKTDLSLTSYTSSELPVKYRLDRSITAYSVEAGKQYKYNKMITIEPKVEVSYAHADAKNFTSNYGNHIRYGNIDSLSTKAALAVGYKNKLSNGGIIEPFVQTGIIKEWAGKTNVIYDGVKYQSEMKGISVEFGGGLNMQITRSTSIYSSIMYETGGNIQSISGDFGVRYTW